MNKFNALLLKDFRINRKMLKLPIWITAGFYLVTIVLVVLAFIHHGIDVELADLQMLPQDFLNYIVNISIVSFPSLMCLIFTVMLTQGALNDDIRQNSELFHRSQPISIWKRSLSKFIIAIGGNWMIMLIIILFNFLVVNIILGIYGRFIFYPAISGVLQGIIITIRASLIIGSLTFLASGIFKDKAFFQMLGILVGVNILFFIINILFDYHLPLPLNYLIELIKGGASGINFGDYDMVNLDVRTIINSQWNTILLNWKIFLQVGFSGLFFALGTWIYKSREVK